MDNKDYRRVKKAAIRQGWRIKPVADGEMFYSPNDAVQALWHTAHSSSDPKALDAHVRRLRRGGFRWPR